MSISWTLENEPLAFSHKRTAEALIYGFDFKNILGSGESINSTGWSIISIRPAGVPVTNMIFGTPTISGTKTFQTIRSGIDNTLYSVVAQITTNLNNVLEENALLLVTNSAYK